jgi:hypothetical protein
MIRLVAISTKPQAQNSKTRVRGRSTFITSLHPEITALCKVNRTSDHFVNKEQN